MEKYRNSKIVVIELGGALEEHHKTKIEWLRLDIQEGKYPQNIVIRINKNPEINYKNNDRRLALK